MRKAIRHRLGMLPFTELAGRQCDRCTTNGGTRFIEDPDHFHSCAPNHRTLALPRHNNIVQVLMDLGRAVGYTCSREPNLHVRPEGQSSMSSKNYNSHADILMLKHNQRIYIDVTVTRPTSVTNMRTQKSSLVPLNSTIGRSKAKHAKYDELARVNNYDLVPFVMESYGGFGIKATRLLTRLSTQSPTFTPAAFL